MGLTGNKNERKKGYIRIGALIIAGVMLISVVLAVLIR